MNKKGIVFFYYLAIGISIVIMGIALASPIKSVIDESMTGLTCTAPASDFDQATCWFLDIIKFLFVGGIIFIGLLILSKKK